MLRSIKKLVKNEKGFTLVELLAVIAILAIVVAIAVPTIGNVIGDSEDKAHEANVNLIKNAAKLAYVSDLNTGSDEAYSLDDLVEYGFLDEVPTDINDGYNYTKEQKVTVKENDNGGLIIDYTAYPDYE